MSNKSGRLAERLIILLDFTTGLLNRVYHCVRHNYGPLVDCLKVDIIKHLSSKADDPTEGIECVSGYDVLERQRNEIEKETKFIYDTLVDVVKATAECEKLFETLSSEIVEFNLHTNIDLTTRFLAVFSDYVRLHLLLPRIREAKVTAYCHMIAYHYAHNDHSEKVNEVKDLLFKSREPIKMLQTKFRSGNLSGQVGKSLHQALKSIRSEYETWTNHEMVKQKNVFNLIFTQDKKKRDRLAEPMNLEEFSFFYASSHIDKIGSWILCMYIVFPELLGHKATGEGADLLKLAFMNRQVVVLVRDEIIDMIEIYSNLQKYSLQSFKVQPKKLYRNILKRSDARDICNSHYQMRNFLNHELKSLTQLIDTVPGIIPAKLPVLMSIIALARHEVLWVFHHCAAQQGNKVKKYLETGNAKDGIAHTYALLPELMWQTHNLADIIKRQISHARTYYSEFLAKDLVDIGLLCRSMKIGGHVDTYIIAHLEYIIQVLEDIKKDPEKDRNLEGLRLNWYRASALLSRAGAGGKSEKEKEMSKQLIAKMNMVVEHTRYYDRLDKEIDHRSTFSDLCVFRAQCADVFNHLVSGTFDQCRHWSVFLRIWEQGMRNVHKQMSDEYKEVGGKVLKKADDYIKSAISIIESAIQKENGILDNYSNLRRQYDPEDVLLRQLRGMGRKNLEDQPGMESQFFGVQTEQVKPFSRLKRRLQEASHAFAEVDSLIVFNQELYPGAYLYDALREFFRRKMRKLLEKDEYNIIRPTQYLIRLQNLFNCISDIDSVLEINLQKMTRELLYEQMHDSFVGSLGTAVGVPEDKSIVPTKLSRSKLIHTIKKYYMHFLHNNIQRMVYSPIFDGFCNTAISKSQTHAEDYFSPSELTALCRIIGPQGVRVIDTECHKKAGKQLGKIVEIIIDNEKLLKRVDVENFYGMKKWHELVSRIKFMNELVTNAIGLGSVLLFRKNLREALKRVMREEASFEAKSVELLHERFLRTGVDNGRFNDLSLDFGILSEYSDSMLRRMAADTVPKGDPDGEIWRLYTPIMLGTSFVSDMWKNTRFSCGIGALLNNGFAMAESVHFIISVFARSKEDRVYLLEKYLKIASNTLFYMNSPKMKSKYAGWSVPDLLTYLDYFVTSSKELSPSVLDKCSISCAVIRSQYIATYGEMTEMSSEAQIGAEDDEDEDEVKDEEKGGQS